jgi:hypothetical protein
MWVPRKTRLANGRALKFAIVDGSTPVSYADVIQLWQNDAGFRAFFTALLVDSPFSPFRWETPPVTRETASQPFEFVLLDSPDLARDPDPTAFAEHFTAEAPAGVVEFTNLGGDAILIAPCPREPLPDYAHFAAFLRYSAEAQQHSLWKAVAAAMQTRLGSSPVWLSSAGGGVAWLHLRLDDSPKYYVHAAYRYAPGGGGR